MTILALGWCLGVASVFVIAWTRLRVLEARERQELVHLNTDRAAVPSVEVVALYRHPKWRT